MTYESIAASESYGKQSLNDQTFFLSRTKSRLDHFLLCGGASRERTLCPLSGEDSTEYAAHLQTCRPAAFIAAMDLTEALHADRSALLSLIAKLSFRLGDFTLASGAKSDYYIDCRTTTLDAEGGRLSGLVFAELIRQHAPEAEAVGGLTMGADPLVSNTASASAWYALAHTDGKPVHGFLVRKAMKQHGTGRQIEGYVRDGAQVVVVDDVCTTGGSTITAIEAVQAAGMKVAAVLCLVDREQGGRANIQAGIGQAPFVSVFTASDVRAEKLKQPS